ncbi:hypothetical protein B0T16DRAFT_455513 [Cercophora newfieldiana]|uniref:Uncharacterized protein n=1 Tax=Cercophora newfieldiana TaxID=92897 RepID=A0AA40CRI9_9PEZI|nr:hypothetical protein B0T16DRAFT_455513 [Cercophora newfieldiana]
MKFLIVSLVSLAVSAADVEPRQFGGGWGGGWRGKGQPSRSAIVIFTPIPATTARTTARTTSTTARTTGTVRTTTVFTSIRTLTTTARQSAVPVVPAPVCEWTGHCIGDACNADEECDLDYYCNNKKCAAAPVTVPVPVPTSTARATSTARTTSTARAGSATGGARTTTVFVTAPRPTTTARAPVIVTTVIPNRPPGGGQTPSCGDNPIACVGTSCRTDADCGFDLILCTNGVCSL